MAYTYGDKVTRTNDNGTKRTWRTFIKYEIETTATKVNYTVSLGVENCSNGSMSFGAKKLDTYLYLDGTQKKHSQNSSKISLDANPGEGYASLGGYRKTIISSYSGSFTRGDSDATHTIKGKNIADSSSTWHGMSTAILNVNVPAVGLPDVETRSVIEGNFVYHYITVTPTSSVIVDYIDNQDRTDVVYQRIISYSDGVPTTGGFSTEASVGTDRVTLTTEKKRETIDAEGNVIRTESTYTTQDSTNIQHTLPAPTVVEDSSSGNTIRVTTTVSLNIVIKTPNIYFVYGGIDYLALCDFLVTTQLYFNNSVTPFETTCILKGRYDRQWHIEFEVSGASSYPDVDAEGYGINLSVSAYPYENGAFSGTADEIEGRFRITKVGVDSSTPPQYTWKIGIDLGEDYVDDPLSLTPDAKIKVDWANVSYIVPDGDRAFYNTTKNMNFANGLANSVFVGGCNVPNFTSRVWYSKVNNPLYFPDTNYMEVGSNDTAVYGLTKVGDYLCIVKQGKTTDTSIYLAYPTSFEDDTAYAVKQGLSGVGADSRFSFNIMNEEALFLSNIGVMAIVPTETEEKRIQNRSYFIDKKLAEENHEEAYSFVFDNMYYLAFPNGHCYVLDGNQRNSWGNDKTNLVYECYYLENVAANNFVKFKHQLWFSTDNNLCRFKTDDDKYPYADGYFGATEEEDNFTPVEAEWSTKFDDDGSIHYYKTMQKKGNVVSILPSDYKYTLVSVTEEEWNADREKYFEITDDGYERCNSESAYNGGTYYIRDVSATKVYVRKDANEPFEIQRKFNERSRIPSEMILKKKFKKYKRLQFIIRNDEDEPFGIDEIIKSYTIGNYAKK